MTGSGACDETTKKLLWNAYKKLDADSKLRPDSKAFQTRVRLLRHQIADLAVQVESLYDQDANGLFPRDEPEQISLWTSLTDGFSDAIEKYKEGRSRRKAVRLGTLKRENAKLKKELEAADVQAKPVTDQ